MLQNYFNLILSFFKKHDDFKEYSLFNCTSTKQILTTQDDFDNVFDKELKDFEPIEGVIVQNSKFLDQLESNKKPNIIPLTNILIPVNEILYLQDIYTSYHKLKIETNTLKIKIKHQFMFETQFYKQYSNSRLFIIENEKQKIY